MKLSLKEFEGLIWLIQNSRPDSIKLFCCNLFCRFTSSINGAATLSITTFSVMALNIMSLFSTLGRTTLCIEWHYAECCVSFIVMLNFVMLSVVMLSVIMLSVVMLNVVAPHQRTHIHPSRLSDIFKFLTLTYHFLMKQRIFSFVIYYRGCN